MSTKVRKLRIPFCHLLLILPLAACDAGHLGNPLTLPVRGVGAATQNAIYDARRGRVSDYLAANRAGLADPAIQAELWDVSKVPPQNQSKVLAEIAALPGGPNWTEMATVIVMVHS